METRNKVPTLADISDKHGERLRVAEPLLRSLGGLSAFRGEVSTLSVYEDNTLVRRTLDSPGNGKVLVVDGGGSLRCALLGDMLAQLGIDSGWSGVVINGCIRDSKAISKMPIGVMALATNPVRSRKQDRGESNIELAFAGIAIRPGDWLYADEDGFAVSESRLEEI